MHQLESRLLPSKNRHNRTILDDSKIIKKYATTEDKLFMTIEEAIILSREIAHRVSALPEQPEVVIGIGGGARLMSKIISSELHLPMEIIIIRRKASIVKEKLSRIPGLVKFSSLWYEIPSLNAPLKFIIDQFSSIAPASHQLTLKTGGKRVLLIDDVIETEQTLNAARNFLRAEGAQSVKTAVLVWSDRNASNKKNCLRPDIFIGRRVQHFPWSMNSPYFHENESWLRQNHV